MQWNLKRQSSRERSCTGSCKESLVADSAVIIVTTSNIFEFVAVVNNYKVHCRGKVANELKPQKWSAGNSHFRAIAETVLIYKMKNLALSQQPKICFALF